MVDLYCERLGDGLLGEPFNFISNMAFFLSGYLVWRLIKKSANLDKSIYFLMSLIFIIGLGSSVFHSFARSWALMMDVIPISIFQVTYLWIYLRKRIRLPILYTVLFLTLLLILSGIAFIFSDILNGSIMYIPAFLFILGLGIWHYMRGNIERYNLLFASGIFCLSLTFRSIDQIICPYFPTGSHFIWHLLNGILLYVLMRDLILNYNK